MATATAEKAQSPQTPRGEGPKSPAVAALLALPHSYFGVISFVTLSILSFIFNGTVSASWAGAFALGAMFAAMGAIRHSSEETKKKVIGGEFSAPLAVYVITCILLSIYSVPWDSNETVPVILFFAVFPAVASGILAVNVFT